MSFATSYVGFQWMMLIACGSGWSLDAWLVFCFERRICVHRVYL